MDKKFNYEKYQEYIKSDEWKFRRKAVIDERGEQCQKCGKITTRNKLEVHHLSYDFEFGQEPDEDLQVVCHECHRENEQDLVFFDKQEDKKIQLDKPIWCRFNHNNKNIGLCCFCHKVNIVLTNEIKGIKHFLCQNCETKEISQSIKVKGMITTIKNELAKGDIKV